MVKASGDFEVIKEDMVGKRGKVGFWRLFALGFEREWEFGGCY